MNKQTGASSIEWTRVRQPDGTALKGYTWNPIAGCRHGCAWTMPDGTRAVCYAKTVAETVARSAYPAGFEAHRFHPARLQEPLKLKTPAGIFLDSMADLMGAWVPEGQITQVLDVCEHAHWHTFFLLTKHAPRLRQFHFSPNVWVGGSSPPDHMHGHAMSRARQAAMLDGMLRTLGEVDAVVRWMSFEPLSWDVADLVSQYPGVLRWAVIGAASAGKMHYPPDPAHLQRLLAVLDAQGVPVFFKGNLRSLPGAAAAWREDFPALASISEPQQRLALAAQR